MRNNNHNKKIKVFIIAGEVSGDVLGARIMRELPDAEFFGVGGENMIAAGLQSLVPISDLAVMGVIEVLGRARTLTRRIRQVADAVIATQPDIVLTIDAPGFARGVVKRVRKSAAGRDLIQHGMKFHHVVAPQVWAWRAGRAKKYARTFDKLYAFFDFEVPYFTKYGLDTVAVGHPISDGLVGRRRARVIDGDVKDADKVITMAPGSRMSEVRRLMPLFRDVAHRLTAAGYIGYRFVIPTVETTAEYVQQHTANWDVPVELVSSAVRYKIYSQTYIAVAASGTVSAELAMLHIPAVIVYKMNPITTWLARRVLRIHWVSLVNILLNRCVYPEYLGPAATSENVVNAIRQLAMPSVRRTMIAELKSADRLWHRANGTPAAIIAKSVRNAAVKK